MPYAEILQPVVATEGEVARGGGEVETAKVAARKAAKVVESHTWACSRRSRLSSTWRAWLAVDSARTCGVTWRMKSR